MTAPKSASRITCLLLVVLLSPQTGVSAFPRTVTSESASTNWSSPQQDAAAAALAEAERLRKAGTPESLSEALKNYQTAMRLCRTTGNAELEARALFGAALTYYAVNDPRKAIELLEQSRSIWQKLNNDEMDAESISILGQIYSLTGDNRNAISAFEQSLPLRKKMGDKKGEGSALYNLGALHVQLQNTQKAIEFFNQAIQILRESGDQSGEAQALLAISTLYSKAGDQRQTVLMLERARRLYKAIKDKGNEAQVLVNLARSYTTLNIPNNAVRYYREALPLLRDIGDKVSAAIVLNNIANVTPYSFDGRGIATQEGIAAGSWVMIEIGQFPKFFEMSERQLKNCGGSRLCKAGEWGNQAFVYDLLGDSQNALDLYDKAIQTAGDIKDSFEPYALQCRLTLGKGRAYFSAGDYQKASEFFESGLSFCTQKKLNGERGLALGAVGLIAEQAGDYRKANAYFEEGLRLVRGSQKGAVRYFEPTLLLHLGITQGRIGKVSEAYDSMLEALAVNPHGFANTHGNTDILYHLAVIAKESGNITGARRLIEAALTTAESLRSSLAQPDLRSMYHASVNTYYEFYIDLLTEMHQSNPKGGFGVLAFQASERARARSLVELLSAAEGNLRNKVNPKLLESERLLHEKLNVKAQEQFRSESNFASEQKESALASEITTLTRQLNDVRAQIVSENPQYAELSRIQPPSLSDVMQTLDGDTVLLEYFLGEKASHLWVLSSDNLLHYSIPDRKAIEESSKRLYGILANNNKTSFSNGEYLKEANALSEMILAPAIPALRKKKRLVIVSDGALQYIPFSALPIPGNNTQSTIANRGSAELSPMIVAYEIVSAPSASTLVVMRRAFSKRQAPGRSVAVLADPVFDTSDERVKGAKPMVAAATAVDLQTQRILKQVASKNMVNFGQAFIPRLPYTRNEAKQILELSSSTTNLEALDFKATRQTASSPELSQFRYVHFATHGYLDSEHPELSAIVLSLVDELGNWQDGFLRTHEVYNLNLPAELVVLSACETGLGRQIKGEGLVGLTRGFMYAGTARVVVSLWSVNDKATAELMTQFYRKLLIEQQPPAAALRAAQLETWKQKAWEAPYYWAAFILQGEWK